MSQPYSSGFQLIPVDLVMDGWLFKGVFSYGQEPWKR